MEVGGLGRQKCRCLLVRAGWRSCRRPGWRCKLRLLAEAFCPSPVSIFCHGRSFALQGFAGTYCDRCDSGHFGEECLACPGKGPGYVCSQRGTCSDGKAGDGNCTCVAPFKDTDRVTGCGGECGPGTEKILNTTSQLFECRKCAAGRFKDGSKPAAPCQDCAKGSFCPEGAVNETDCAAGFYCPTVALQLNCSTTGAYCPPRSTAEGSCPAGKFCVDSATTQDCTKGSFCKSASTAQLDCPAGFYCPSPAQKETCDTKGTFCGLRSTVATTKCPAGQAQLVCACAVWSRCSGLVATAPGAGLESAGDGPPAVRPRGVVIADRFARPPMGRWVVC